MADDTARGGHSLGIWTIGDTGYTQVLPADADPLSIWVKIGLTGLFLALATPMVGLAGLWMTAMLGQLVAEGLELSHATLPAFPLDGDWDLRLAYLLALVAMGLRAAVSRLPRARWTVAGLGPWPWWLLSSGGLWLTACAALVFEQHVLDVADGTHLVLLGATFLWTLASAIWLLASAGHAAMVGLVIAAQRSRVLGMSTAAGGIVAMAVATPVLANADQLDDDDVYRDAPVIAGALAQLDEARDDLNQSMRGRARGGGATTAALPPAAGGNTLAARYTVAECMEELVTRGPGKRLSPVDEVIQIVERRLEGRDLARDIVHTKLIDICEDQPARHGPPLLHLLQRASRYGRIDVFRGDRQARLLGDSPYGQAQFAARCLIDGRSDVLTSFEELQHKRYTIEAALDTLSDRDERLIREHYFEGREYADMAAAWDMRKDSINRRTTRAVERLGERLEVHCH